MRTRRLAILLALAAFGTGCGNDDGGDEPTGESRPTTQAEPATGADPQRRDAETKRDECKRLENVLDGMNTRGLEGEDRAAIERQIDMIREQMRLAGCR